MATPNRDCEKCRARHEAFVVSTSNDGFDVVPTNQHCPECGGTWFKYVAPSCLNYTCDRCGLRFPGCRDYIKHKCRGTPCSLGDFLMDRSLSRGTPTTITTRVAPTITTKIKTQCACEGCIPLEGEGDRACCGNPQWDHEICGGEVSCKHGNVPTLQSGTFFCPNCKGWFADMDTFDGHCGCQDCRALVVVHKRTKQCCCSTCLTEAYQPTGSCCGGTSHYHVLCKTADKEEEAKDEAAAPPPQVEVTLTADSTSDGAVLHIKVRDTLTGDRARYGIELQQPELPLSEQGGLYTRVETLVLAFVRKTRSDEMISPEQLRITYVDPEGDDIRITCTAELAYAAGLVGDDPLHLEVRLTGDAPTSEAEVPTVEPLLAEPAPRLTDAPLVWEKVCCDYHGLTVRHLPTRREYYIPKNQMALLCGNDTGAACYPVKSMGRLRNVELTFHSCTPATAHQVFFIHEAVMTETRHHGSGRYLARQFAPALSTHTERETNGTEWRLESCVSLDKLFEEYDRLVQDEQRGPAHVRIDCVPKGHSDGNVTNDYVALYVRCAVDEEAEEEEQKASDKPLGFDGWVWMLNGRYCDRELITALLDIDEIRWRINHCGSDPWCPDWTPPPPVAHGCMVGYYIHEQDCIRVADKHTKKDCDTLAECIAAAREYVQQLDTAKGRCEALARIEASKQPAGLLLPKDWVWVVDERFEDKNRITDAWDAKGIDWRVNGRRGEWADDWIPPNPDYAVEGMWYVGLYVRREECPKLLPTYVEEYLKSEERKSEFGKPEVWVADGEKNDKAITDGWDAKDIEWRMGRCYGVGSKTMLELVEREASQYGYYVRYEDCVALAREYEENKRQERAKAAEEEKVEAGKPPLAVPVFEDEMFTVQAPDGSVIPNPTPEKEDEEDESDQGPAPKGEEDDRGWGWAWKGNSPPGDVTRLGADWTAQGLRWKTGPPKASSKYTSEEIASHGYTGCYMFVANPAKEEAELERLMADGAALVNSLANKAQKEEEGEESTVQSADKDTKQDEVQWVWEYNGAPPVAKIQSPWITKARNRWEESSLDWKIGELGGPPKQRRADGPVGFVGYYLRKDQLERHRIIESQERQGWALTPEETPTYLEFAKTTWLVVGTDYYNGRVQMRTYADKESAERFVKEREKAADSSHFPNDTWDIQGAAMLRNVPKP